MSGNKQKLNEEPEQEDIQKIKELINSGQFAEAEVMARKLISKNLNSVTLLNLLGVSLITQKKFDDAELNYIKLIKIKPDFAEGYNNLAHVYMEKKKNEKAIKNFKQALIYKPSLNQAHFNLSKIYTINGNDLQKNNKIQESVYSYESAIKHDSKNLEAHNNLGVALQALNKNNEAIYSFKTAINIKYDYFEAHNNLGNSLIKLHKNSEAIKSFDEAIKIKPDYVEAYNNLGIVFNKLGDFEKSLKYFQKTIELDPNYANAYSNLAASFSQQGKFDEAIKNYNMAFELEPEKTQYAINSKLILPMIPDSVKDINLWRKKYVNEIESLKKYKFSIDDPQRIINPSTFCLAYNENDNLKIMKGVSTFFRNIIPIINYKIQKRDVVKSKGERIKVGFISEFFTDHTIGKLFKGLIKKIDRKQFEVIVFHASNTKPGQIKEEINSYADLVINLFGKIDVQQKLIEDEKLDIIFYPDIGMTTSTYFLAHARLAPIQITSHGHPDTSGIDTIDYFVSSSHMETKGSNAFYSERLICLNSAYMHLIPPEKPKIKLDRLALGLPEKKNIYCCPQTLFKIHPKFDLALSKIVEKDSNAQIVMIETKYKDHMIKIKKRWSNNFPELEKRVLFLKSMPLDKFLSLIEISNVLLDPFYFGGGLSFTETLVVGTPTVTMPTKFMRSRVTAGLYKQMKISNAPIADSLEQYVELAVELATNTKKNSELRKSLQDSAKLYLFNNQQSLNQFEKFLEKAHEACIKGTLLKDGYVVE